VDITCAEALSNAARNLTNAETVSDLALMERLIAIANAWTDLASLLSDREKV
jgi:hypothetical protein